MGGESQSWGRTHSPPTLHTQPPNRGAAPAAAAPARFFFFFFLCSAPTTIRTPPSQVSRNTAATPILQIAPPSLRSDLKPCARVPSLVLPGIQCNGGEGRARTSHGGRGGDPPPARLEDPLPSSCSPPFLGSAKGHREAAGSISPLSRVPCAPLPKSLLGVPGRIGGLLQACREG